jgi:hypothetical protein
VVLTLRQESPDLLGSKTCSSNHLQLNFRSIVDRNQALLIYGFVCSPIPEEFKEVRGTGELVRLISSKVIETKIMVLYFKSFMYSTYTEARLSVFLGMISLK